MRLTVSLLTLDLSIHSISINYVVYTYIWKRNRTYIHMHRYEMQL